jgi:tetratricopeptide (TPR) repeat protein
MSNPKSGIQWLIKTQNGKQIGPYGTEAVLRLISEGAFAGLEEIKRYPDGRWTPISKQPDFYDKLLEALEEIDKVPKSKRPAENHQANLQKFEMETVIIKPPDEKTEIIDKKKEKVLEKISTEAINPNSVRMNPVIDLRKIKDLEDMEKKKSMLLPISLIGACLIIGGVFIFWQSGDSHNSKPSLLFPKKTSASTMSSNDIKSGIQKAISSYTQDTYEGYNDAQNKLVSVIEGAPQNTGARGSLCLVYKELWPYVKQDTNDVNAVIMMAKATRSLDPTGIDGIYCEVAKLMTQGKYKEARGVVEYALNQPAISTAPVLYALKAELLYEERDVPSAMLYMQKASQLWPEWLKPVFDLGRFQARAEKPAEAAKSLQTVLQRNPKHKLAQIEYGILIFKSYRQNEEAIKILSAAISADGKLSRLDEARAQFFLALIYADKSDLKQVKNYASKAYQLNSGDAQIKELLIRLGGSTVIGGKAAQNNELVYLGDQHLRTGNCLAAQAEYKAAFELDPTNAIAAMKAAKCLWTLSQGDEAINWLQKAIMADPKLTTAYVLQADYLSQRFNFLQATQILNKASKVFSNNYEVLRGYGLIEFRRNNIKDAIAYLQRANKIYENDIETLILLAKAFSASGDFSSAQKYAVRAIEIDATNNEAQIVYAQVLTKFQGLETGLIYLRDLINKFSYTMEFRYALADLYREQERSIQAQRIYEQIVDADPRNKKARLGLGETYQQQGLSNKALKEYLQAAVIDPSDAEGLYRAGILYYETGKNKEAIIQLKRAQSINPMYPRLNYFMGRVYFQNGDFDLALKSALDERKLNPNLADSYILAAEIYSAQKQFQKCAGEYQQAIKLRPVSADLYVKIARCYRQGGSSDIAESMLNIAASQESGLPEIYREQGAIYEIKGDIRAAVQAYNKYLALSPNAPDRSEVEAKILSLSRGK